MEYLLIGIVVVIGSPLWFGLGHVTQALIITFYELVIDPICHKIDDISARFE